MDTRKCIQLVQKRQRILVTVSRERNFLNSVFDFVHFALFAHRRFRK